MPDSSSVIVNQNPDCGATWYTFDGLDADKPISKRAIESIPHIDQYFGVYAMEEGRFLGIYEYVKTLERLQSHIEARRGDSDLPPVGDYRVENGVAVIEIVGSMTKYGSSLSDLPHGTIGIRKAVRAAVNDPEVKGIMLVIDSPGGTVAGTADLAAEVKGANAKKPVTAYCEDLCASAAYWVASQAGKVIANQGALVGSIGTYMVVNDFSGYYAKEGIKTHVIKAGKFKGAGVPGAEITPEQLESFQQMIDEINSVFVESVAEGRDVLTSKIEDLADGRVHEASSAKRLGLIDAVQNYDLALKQLRARCKDPRRGAGAEAKPVFKESIVTDETKTDSTAPKPASLDELELFCPGADNDFLMGQLRKKATEDQARSAWTEELLRQKAELKEKLEVKEKADDLPGAEPIEKKGSKIRSFGGDVKAEWAEAIREKEKAGLPRAKAVRAVAHERPELREALIEQANEGRH